MAADKTQLLSTMTTRQKITGGIVVLVVIFLVWQAIGLFKGGNKVETPPPSTMAAKGMKPPFGQPNQPGNPMSSQSPGDQASTPQPVASLPVAPVMTQREAELLRLQQQTEAKYLIALNELQLLKIDREIAETNKAIAAAKLDMVTAQKGVIDLLAPPAPKGGGIGQNLLGGQQGPGQQASQPAVVVPLPPKEVTYNVVSVTQLQYRWNAVLVFKTIFTVFMSATFFLPMVRKLFLSIKRCDSRENGEKKKVSIAPIVNRSPDKCFYFIGVLQNAF